MEKALGHLAQVVCELVRRMLRSGISTGRKLQCVQAKGGKMGALNAYVESNEGKEGAQCMCESAEKLGGEEQSCSNDL